MKQPILLFFILSTSFTSFCQTSEQVELASRMDIVHTTTPEGTLAMEQVVQSSNSEATKEQIFENIKRDIAKVFPAGLALIDYQNKEEGDIFIKGRTGDLVYKNGIAKVDGGYFEYDLSFICKDGRAKILIENIIHTGGRMGQMRPGSNFGDDFPSTWTAAARKQSGEQWAAMKQTAYNDLLHCFQVFRDSITGSGNNSRRDF